MAKIFVSHSKKDTHIRDFFLNAFAGTNVKPLFEELEEELPTGVNAQKIESDIFTSNAVFVLLSENVETLKHTRDWINWECGTAKNKEIWVFEPHKSLGKISVAVPRFNHYVAYDLDEECRKDIRHLIESVDDTHILKAVGAGAAGGAILNKKDRLAGAFTGALVGLAGVALSSLSNPALGFQIACIHCNSIYKVYRFGTFRCAVCNGQLLLTRDMVQQFQSPHGNRMLTNES